MSHLLFFMNSGFTFSKHGLFIIDFIALVLLLYFLVRKMVRAALKARADQVRENISTAQSRYKKIAQKFEVIKGRLEKLEQDREKIIANIKREGVREKEQIIAGARATARRIEEEASREVDFTRKSREGVLIEELINKTIADVVEHITTRFGSEDHARLNSTFIDKLEKQPFTGENAR